MNRPRAAVPAVALAFTLLGGCLPPKPDTADEDGDGYRVGDGDGYDCDDSDPAVHPEQDEQCHLDGEDTNCDGLPQGDPLPFVDLLDDGLADGWEIVVGDTEQLTPGERGLTIERGPLVLSRAFGALCWESYRLTVGWELGEDTDFELEVGVHTQGEWHGGDLRPASAYVLNWERDGGHTKAEDGFGHEFDLYRRRDGDNERINRGSWSPAYEDYQEAPFLVVEVVHGAESTRIGVGGLVGHKTLMYRSDPTAMRSGAGGVYVAIRELSDPVTLHFLSIRSSRGHRKRRVDLRPCADSIPSRQRFS